MTGRTLSQKLPRFAVFALPALMTCFAAPPSTPNVANPAQSSSFQGSFASDVDQREFYFTLANPGPVTVKTLSYAGAVNAAGATIGAGGFDTTLSVFDSAGLLVALNQDGGCGVVGSDPVTASCWDAYISTTLPAGTYRIVLTQSGNLPASPLIGDSFAYNPTNLFSGANLVNGVPLPPFGGFNTFTAPPGQTGSFWDASPNQRTSFYALDVIGTTAAEAAVSNSISLPAGVKGLAYSSLTFTGNIPGVTFT